jgi:hypothetical protein
MSAGSAQKPAVIFAYLAQVCFRRTEGAENQLVPFESASGERFSRRYYQVFKVQQAQVVPWVNT